MTIPTMQVNAAQTLREAVRNGALDEIPEEAPPPVGYVVQVDDANEESMLDEVVGRLEIGDDDHDLVRDAYRQACNTVKLYKLQRTNAQVMDERALVDQFDGAMRRAARAVIYLEDAYPWLRK